VRITELLPVEAIHANLKATDKEGAIRELVHSLAEIGTFPENDEETVVRVLMARERAASTGIGQGIGLPHGKGPFVKQIVGAIGISKGGIDFGAIDGNPVKIVLLLLAPPDSAGAHLKALARISKIVKDRRVRDSLTAAKDEQQVFRILQEQDRKVQ
jgi:PTS system nitrogen regulatory IIA component